MTTTIVVTAPDQPINVEIRRQHPDGSSELLMMLKASESWTCHTWKDGGGAIVITEIEAPPADEPLFPMTGDCT